MTTAATGGYPPTWHDVAEIRALRTTPNEWARLISWRADMQVKGWKLLRVNTRHDQMVVVFGRTRPR